MADNSHAEEISLSYDLVTWEKKCTADAKNQFKSILACVYIDDNFTRKYTSIYETLWIHDGHGNLSSAPVKNLPSYKGSQLSFTSKPRLLREGPTVKWEVSYAGPATGCSLVVGISESISGATINGVCQGTLSINQVVFPNDGTLSIHPVGNDGTEIHNFNMADYPGIFTGAKFDQNTSVKGVTIGQ